jgi:hypothetical protein
MPIELIQAGGETLLSEIYKYMNSIFNKEELPDQWKESIIVAIYKKAIKMTVVSVILVGCHCCRLHIKFYPISFSQG